MSEILDSGKRREWESGAVRDNSQGKGRCDLLPLGIIAVDAERGMDRVMIGLDKFLLGEGDERELYKVLHIFCQLREWEWETMLLEVAIHMENALVKYPERNWEKGIPVHSYIDSAVRHYLKWRRGDEDEPHDRAFCWNVLAMLWTMQNKPEMDDRPGKRWRTDLTDLKEEGKSELWDLLKLE